MRVASPGSNTKNGTYIITSCLCQPHKKNIPQNNKALHLLKKYTTQYLEMPALFIKKKVKTGLVSINMLNKISPNAINNFMSKLKSPSLISYPLLYYSFYTFLTVITFLA